MIERNLMLVMHTVWSMPQRGLDREDMVSFGNIGLIKAVDSFDPDRGIAFSTYASACIAREIHRGHDNEGRLIRLPAYIAGRTNKYLLAREMIEREIGCEASFYQVAEQLMVGETALSQFIRATDFPASLDATVTDEDVAAMMHDKRTDVEREVIESAMRQSIDDAFDDLLNEQQKVVLRMRYGLEDGNVYNQRVVAMRLGVTFQRVQQIQRKALNRLRNPWNAGRLRDYMTA